MTTPNRNPLLEGFFRRLVADPTGIAIQFSPRQAISFEQLFFAATTVGAELQQRGFRRGDRIALLARPGPGLFATIIATLQLGGVPVLADPGMGRDVFRARMAAAQPTWVYLDRALDQLNHHPILRWVIERHGQFVPRPTDVPTATVIVERRVAPMAITSTELQARVAAILNAAPFPDGDDQVIVFTSGTTTEPKGVRHTIGSLRHSLEHISRICAFTPDSLVYTGLPYFLLMAIAAGVRTATPPTKFSATRWRQDIERLQPSHLFSAPSEMLAVIRQFERQKKQLPDSLSLIMLGSAPVTKPLLVRTMNHLSKKTKLYGVYGLTEMLPVAIVDGRQKIHSTNPGDLLGELVPDVTARTTPDGELMVSSPHMSPGYLGKAPHQEIATGDIVRLDGRQLTLLGRKKDMIIRGNYNIYPRLYEPTVERIPGVSGCAIIGLWDEQKNDERVILVVEAEPGQEQSIVTTVKKYLAKPEHTIDAAAAPDEILALTLPRFGRQAKVDKERLRTMITSQR